MPPLRFDPEATVEEIKGIAVMPALKKPSRIMSSNTSKLSVGSSDPARPEAIARRYPFGGVRPRLLFWRPQSLRCGHI